MYYEKLAILRFKSPSLSPKKYNYYLYLEYKVSTIYKVLGNADYFRLLESRAGSERVRAEADRILTSAANAMVKAWNTTNQVLLVYSVLQVV